LRGDIVLLAENLIPPLPPPFPMSDGKGSILATEQHHKKNISGSYNAQHEPSLMFPNDTKQDPVPPA